ncbi:MAG: chromate resistance protein [Desulfobacterales bacterium]|nr:chromate resistance protein [Desulfobacterales bacterium]
MRVTFKIVLLLLVLGLVNTGHARDSHLYITWPGLEADKCASAWLIARFVDQKATFRFVERGSVSKEGVSFDTPQSEFRTTHRSTTFGAIYWKYELSDTTLSKVRRIIWDIELNKWEAPLTPEGKGIEALINGLRRKEGETIEALKKSFVLFDWLYAHFQEE